jgi:hypothetical protein
VYTDVISREGAMGGLVKTIKSELAAHWFTAALLVMLAAMVWQNFSLSRANRDLRQRFDSILGTYVQLGDHLGEIRGNDPSGFQVTKSAIGSTGSLILEVSSTCGICVKNMDAWQRLAQRARTRNIRVIWVSRDPVKQASELVQQYHIKDSMIAEPSHWTWVELKLGAVPQTLVVSPDGIVQKVLLGAIDSQSEQDLARALGVIPSNPAAGQ